MSEALKTLMVTVIILSGIELLIPEGNIKKTTESVMGMVTAAIVITEIVRLFLTVV